jgi:hypothetical protein
MNSRRKACIIRGKGALKITPEVTLRAYNPGRKVAKNDEQGPCGFPFFITLKT